MLQPNSIAGQRDEDFMRRCFDLAVMGLPRNKTNPLVGCCIVYNDRIIGEGFHRAFGHDHAEIDAINSVNEKDIRLLNKSTLYVNLAPCNHQGKTSPCSHEIIRSGIPRVVIGCDEVNPKATGGVQYLRDHGVDVTVGVLQEEAEKVIERFTVGVLKHRPFITLKWAESSDGLIGKEDQEVKLSTDTTSLFVHQLRSEHNAILIGGGTAITDNPELTTRHVPGDNPLRIVLTGTRELPQGADLMTDDHELIVFSKKPYSYDFPNKKKRILLRDELVMSELMEELYHRYHIGSILVEGGRHVLSQFIDADLWDVSYRIIAHKSLTNGVEAPKINDSPVKIFNIDSDRIEFYRSSSSLR